MSILRHWHPVLRSVSLRHKPLGIRLAGRDLVLFRPAPDRVGALIDRCSHRRMRLSLGTVCAGHLRCPYHGWSFDEAGQGESPGTPKLRARVDHFLAREAHGLIWVREQGPDSPLPTIDSGGGVLGALLEHQIKAPLELALDNFSEIEHTSVVHDVIGSPLEQLHEVVSHVETTDDSVSARNSGPARPFNLALRLLLGVRSKQHHFHSDWTTHFSPVHSITDHYWKNPHTGKEAMVRWRFIHFFTPVDEALTQVWTYFFVKTRYPLPGGGVPLFRWLIRWLGNQEINRDRLVLEGLAAQDVGLEGMKLSRFDRSLGLNRDRISRIYRGLPSRDGSTAC